MARGWWLGVVLITVLVIMALWKLSWAYAKTNDIVLPREALNYAGNHTTLWGKIAALAHFDVVKTSEPLTCSDGVANFTCLLSKTDVKPILSALRKAGIEAEATAINASWVLILYYNYSTSDWQWKNYTTIKAWELKWQNQTTRIYQTEIKEHLNNMYRLIKTTLEDVYRYKKIRNVTSIRIWVDTIIIGTNNGTKGKVDPKTAERIRKWIRQDIGSDARVEVIYSESLELFSGGLYPVSIQWNSNGQYKYSGSGSCTLGYTGYLYGDTNLPVFVTGWHCFGFVGTDRTSPYSIAFTINQYTLSTADSRTFFNPGPYSWGYYLWWPILYVDSDAALIGARDPYLFSKANVKPGYVIKADGINDLPIISQLGKYDVKVGDTLYARLGRSQITVSGKVTSLCTGGGVTSPSSDYWVVIRCHTEVDISPQKFQGGDSGSPIYRLQSGGVSAYGVLTGRLGYPSLMWAATLDWINVKLTR